MPNVVNHRHGLEHGDIYSHAVEEDDSLHTLVKVNCYKTLDAAEQFAAERRTIGAQIGTPNQIEAVMAGFEKRPAVYADV